MAYDIRIGNSIFPIPIDHSMENREVKTVIKVKYEMNRVEKIELYNLKMDISESNDVAENYPEVVEKIKTLADEMHGLNWAINFIILKELKIGL